MMADRSVSKVFSDIIGNAQEIIRAEILLARTEALDEVVKAKHRAALVASGAVAGILAALFLLLSAFHALSQALPAWSSALIVATAMTILAMILVNAGLKEQAQKPQHRSVVDSPQENH